MQLHEESLCIPVETALADLVRLHLDERVMPTLFLHGKIESTKKPGIGARAGRVCGPIEWKRRKEFISHAKDNGRRELRSEEVFHGVTSRGRLRC